MTYQVATNTFNLPEAITDLVANECQLHLWQEIEKNPAILSSINGFLMYGHMKINGAMMDLMPQLKVISNFGVGVDHINVVDAGARGIAVGNTPRMLDGATADMTFALLMAAARNLIIGDRYARSPDFLKYEPNFMLGLEVHSTTLGIIGMGRIGKQVAKRAKGFDMQVLYYNRNRDLQAEAELGVTYAPLAELLKQSDYVTLNLPLTAESRSIIGREQLRMMKPTAILVNCARGGVMDHEAILEALREKWIYAVATDVTEPEPLPRDHPLLKMDNFIIAPHLGSATQQTRQIMAARTVDNLMLGMRGEKLITQVG